MRFSTVFASSALVATALSATITVSVGKKGESADITFTPSSVKAAVGDIVQFKFWPKNHSVAQAAFAKPCEPLANGFWSGYVPTTDLATAASTTFEYTVTNASAPVWFYCTQGQHCTNGMVGVINENTASGNTLEKFAAAAQAFGAKAVEPTSSPSNATSTPSGTPSGTGSASSGTSSPGAASGLTVNSNFALTGVMGMFAYLLL